MGAKVNLSFMVTAVLALSTSAGWCAGQRVAVVDMARLIKGHPNAKSSESILKSQVEEFEGEQKDMLAEEERLKEQFEEVRGATQNKALSDSAREEKVEAAKEKYRELRTYELKRRETSRLRSKQLADQQLRLRRRIVSAIGEIVKKYGDEKGISLVLDSSAVSVRGTEAVVFYTDKTDITEDILRLVKGAGEGGE